jgi:hypothetical protein
MPYRCHPGDPLRDLSWSCAPFQSLTLLSRRWGSSRLGAVEDEEPQSARSRQLSRAFRLACVFTALPAVSYGG